MRGLRAVLSALCLAVVLHGRAQGVGISYTLTPIPGSDPHTAVTVELSDVAALSPIRLQMPAWSPGDYQVQNHGKYVRAMRAAAASGMTLSVAHPDQNTWEIDARGRDKVTVSYELPNVPPGTFSENAVVTQNWAFYQGSATFVYLADHKAEPATVRVRLPRGWSSALSPMASPSEPPKPGEAAFTAPDYDTLADSPLLVGEHAEAEFTAGGATHVVALFGWTDNEKAPAYAEAIRPVAEELIRLMGGAPFKRYVFFLHLGGRGGGLEHSASCRIAWSNYRGGMAGLQQFVAHEYCHLWSVKRIRPAVLGPFDYMRPPQTHLLWFFEGVTDYVAILSLRRAGLLDDAKYLRELEGNVSELLRMPARTKVTADEASWRVWETPGSSGYGGMSYYTKGHLIGLCLDLKLRALTNGGWNMDRVMRELFRRYGPPKPGCPEDGIRDLLIEAAGAEMGPFYSRLCRSTEELPFAECLQSVGLKFDDGAGMFPSIEVDPNAPADAVRLRTEWLTGKAAQAEGRQASARRWDWGRAWGMAVRPVV